MDHKHKKITVVGAGYVGLSNAVLLARQYPVTLLDINEQKISLISQGVSPVMDEDIVRLLGNESMMLSATTDAISAYHNADYVIIATPTDYDTNTGAFDTSSVEQVVADVVAINPASTIIIKSTVPVGFTENLKTKLSIDSVIFSPEFLREGRALYDNLRPSRIIVGERSVRAEVFASMLADCAIKKDVEILLTNNTEAEAIKLFANTYLALRVAYFNELDTYASTHDLDTQMIIQGVGLDPRIGMHYNNPSFGYGGYCLPKDTQQLLANYRNVPQNLIQAVVSSNETRKRYIATDIMAKSSGVIGVYRLTMKAGSDNFRDSAILDVIRHLKAEGVDVIIYEPMMASDQLLSTPIIKDLAIFKKKSNLIVANRMHDELLDVRHKVYTRDLSGVDI